MSDNHITPGRIAAFYGLLADMGITPAAIRAEGIRDEWAEMNGHQIHNHDTQELLPIGECPRCDWLQKEADE